MSDLIREAIVDHAAAIGIAQPKVSFGTASQPGYEANLSRLEALMDAAPGTPEGDELDVLASLIERYELESKPALVGESVIIESLLPDAATTRDEWCAEYVKVRDELAAHKASGALLLTTPTAALATAAEGFPAWDVLDAAHMLVASLIVDLVADADRPGFLRKMDRVLRDRVKEIAARQRPRLVI